jgi:hypothetical protein
MMVNAAEWRAFAGRVRAAARVPENVSSFAATITAWTRYAAESCVGLNATDTSSPPRQLQLVLVNRLLNYRILNADQVVADIGSTLVTLIRKFVAAQSPSAEAAACLARLVNASDVVNGTLVVLETMSVEDQVRLVGTADILVGVHGNGLTWAGVMQPGGVLIEVWSGRKFNGNYDGFASRGGLIFAAVEHGSATRDPGKSRGDIHVNLLLLRDALNDCVVASLMKTRRPNATVPLFAELCASALDRALPAAPFDCPIDFSETGATNLACVALDHAVCRRPGLFSTVLKQAHSSEVESPPHSLARLKGLIGTWLSDARKKLGFAGVAKRHAVAALPILNAPSLAELLAVAYNWTGVREPLSASLRACLGRAPWGTGAMAACAAKDAQLAQLTATCTGTQAGCTAKHAGDARGIVRCVTACLVLSRLTTCYGLDFDTGRQRQDAATAMNAKLESAHVSALNADVYLHRQQQLFFAAQPQSVKQQWNRDHPFDQY